MNIKELVMKSREARILLNNFASRKRVHVDKLIDTRRLFHILAAKNSGMSQVAYDQAFKDLEAMHYGVLEKDGRYFKAEQSIKDIGLEATPEPERTVKQYNSNVKQHNVVVLFRLQGLRCRAEIPEEALTTFEKLVNI